MAFATWSIDGVSTPGFSMDHEPLCSIIGEVL
jgi:hypothetical protein